MWGGDLSLDILLGIASFIIVLLGLVLTYEWRLSQKQAKVYGRIELIDEKVTQCQVQLERRVKLQDLRELSDDLKEYFDRRLKDHEKQENEIHRRIEEGVQHLINGG